MQFVHRYRQKRNIMGLLRVKSKFLCRCRCPRFDFVLFFLYISRHTIYYLHISNDYMKFSNVSIKINDDIFISSSQYIDLNKVSRVDIRQVNTLSLLQLEYLNCIFKLIEAILHYVEFEIIFGCYRFWAQATLLWTKNFCFLFLSFVVELLSLPSLVSRWICQPVCKI